MAPGAKHPNNVGIADTWGLARYYGGKSLKIQSITTAKTRVNMYLSLYMRVYTCYS